MAEKNKANEERATKTSPLNPGQMTVATAHDGRNYLRPAEASLGMGAVKAQTDTPGTAAFYEDLKDDAEPGDFVQLMYEQSSELDAVDRVTRARREQK